MLKRLFDYIAEYREATRLRREFARMSDRDLNDIGARHRTCGLKGVLTHGSALSLGCRLLLTDTMRSATVTSA